MGRVSIFWISGISDIFMSDFPAADVNRQYPEVAGVQPIYRIPGCPPLFSELPFGKYTL